MQQCPQCGKSLPDHATKCKYCDISLTASQRKTGLAGAGLVDRIASGQYGDPATQILDAMNNSR